MVKIFPQNKEYELTLLKKGDPDFRELREYLEPYLETALGSFEMSQQVYDALYWQLVSDIKKAAVQYLAHNRGAEDYKFSTYYSNFLKERINKTKGIKKKGRLKNRLEQIYVTFPAFLNVS